MRIYYYRLTFIYIRVLKLTNQNKVKYFLESFKLKICLFSKIII